MTAPLSHLQESQKLTADALPNLIEITLVGTPDPVTLCLTDAPTVTWQGKTYEGSKGLKISGIQIDADGKLPRPTLTLGNPFGIYNDAAHKGYFDRAQVIRRRVLRQHLDSNTNLSDVQYWYIGRVKDLVRNNVISFELRMLSDGPKQMVPARMFTPPIFPFVKLT